MNNQSQNQPTKPAPDLNRELRIGLSDIVRCALLLQSRANETDRETLQKILRAGQQMQDLLGGSLPRPENPTENGLSDQPQESVRNVVYVEDNEANFALMSRILELRPDIRLIRADSGQSGVDVTTEIRPELVLLDLNLPDFHGGEVLRRLRANSTTQSIPVIVISADATPSQIEKLLSAGARNYLTKPFSIEMLLAAVDEALAENAVSIAP